MKKKNLSLQERVEANRRGLAKQDAWARNTEAKNVTWMERLTVEELSYGEGARQKLGLAPVRHTDYDVKACLLNCPCTDLKLTALSGFPAADLFMRSFVGLSLAEIKTGACDAELQEKSPLTYVEADFPPTFLIYGQLDQLRFNALALADRLKEKGVDHTLYKSTGIFYGQHTTTMIFKGKKAFTCFEAALAFLKRNLS